MSTLQILSLQKWVGILLFAGGIGWWMYSAITDTRGTPYRLWSRYVMDIEGKLESMFMWQNATYIATVQAAIALTLLSGYVFLQVSAMLWLALVACIAPPLVINSMVDSRRNKIDIQVGSWALALANALKSTASIGDAIGATVAITPKPMLQELELSIKQMRLGSSIPDALLAMSARIQAKGGDIVISAILIGRQSGGDLPVILERTASSLRELQRLEEFTQKTIRGAKQSFGIAAILCAGTIIWLPQLMPLIFSFYRTTVKGQLVASQMAIAYVFAIYLAYKFTRTDI